MMLDAPVSLFAGIHETTPCERIPLRIVLQCIHAGTYRDQVTHLREVLRTQGEKAYKHAKTRSLAFTPCCALSTRDRHTPWAQKLLSCTGLVHLDCDHLEDPEALKHTLAADPYVVFAFTSPGGTGVKVGLAATGITDPDTYKHAWGCTVAYIQRTYPAVHVSVDEHVKYLHALCFVSDDPTLYCNPQAIALEIPPVTPRTTTPPPAREHGTWSYQDVMDMLRAIPADDYETWLKVGMALHSSGESWAYEAYDTWSRGCPEKYAERAIGAKWRSFDAGGDVTMGSLVYLAQAHGWQPPTLRAARAPRGERARPPLTGAPALQETATPAHAVVVAMDCVTAQPVEWLWWPYIAIGSLCMLDGDPGIGKSLLLTQIAATLSRGAALPDQQGEATLPTGEAQHTLLLSTEDSLVHTLKPRLDASGADASKIHVLTGWVDTQGYERVFTLEHLPFLEEEIQRYQPRLVGIDPITAYMGKVDIHRANEVQELLGQLNRLADRYRCAIVGVRHPAKPGQSIGKVIHRGLGSVGFIGTARTGLFVEQHPTNPARVVLAMSKSNLADMGRTQLFSKAQGRFTWCGVSRISAEVLGGSGRGPDPTAFLEAVFWLEEKLHHGVPLPSEGLREEAEEYGIAFRTLRRAKQALQIRSIRRGKDAQDKDAWDWHLPSLTIIPPPPLSGLQDPQGLQGPLGLLGPLQEKQQDRDYILVETPPERGVDLEGNEGQESLEGLEGQVVAPGHTRAMALLPDGPHTPDHATRAALPAPLPQSKGSKSDTNSRFCPGCGRDSTWLIRGEAYVCYKCNAARPTGGVA
jgi:archaellum biogenesis ATPase FlaH